MKITQRLKTLISSYQSTPKRVKNWWIWAWRRALSPYLSLHCWVTLESGARIFLGSDPIDDLILEDIIGKFEPLFFPQEFQCCKDQGFTIMDIGSHHGIYAVEALIRYPNAKLIAVEPVPSSINLIKKNLQANNLLSRSRIVEGGIDVEDGWAYVQHSDTGSWSDKTVRDAEGSSERVQVFSMKTALQGDAPTLVKCNAEGAEFTAFPQMFALGVKPHFVILMAHPESGSVENLLELFKRNGYFIRDAGSTSKRTRLHCFLNST